MDAIKFLKEKNRMVKVNSEGFCTVGCTECPLYSENNGTNKACPDYIKIYPEKAVAIVEKWSAEHPKKTRQDEFLEAYPDAKITKSGVVNICPKEIEKSKKFDCCVDCGLCKKKYWLAEAE